MSNLARICIYAFYLSLLLHRFLSPVHPLVISYALNSSAVVLPILGGMALGVGSGIMENSTGFQGKNDASLLEEYSHRFYQIAVASSIGILSWSLSNCAQFKPDVSFSLALMGIHSFAFGRHIVHKTIEGDAHPNDQELYAKCKHIPAMLVAFMCISRISALRQQAEVFKDVGMIGSALTLCYLN